MKAPLKDMFSSVGLGPNGRFRIMLRKQTDVETTHWVPLRGWAVYTQNIITGVLTEKEAFNYPRASEETNYEQALHAYQMRCMKYNLMPNLDPWIDSPQNEAKEIARKLNSPDYLPNRWELSMRLSKLQQEFGAIGVDAAMASSVEPDECEDTPEVIHESGRRQVSDEHWSPKMPQFGYTYEAAWSSGEFRLESAFSSKTVNLVPSEAERLRDLLNEFLKAEEA